ncbi:MAG: ATP-binding protein [Ktedonobacteraceae bacterium]
MKVPTFDLAIWMLRDRDWPENTQPADIINYFLSAFNITEEERHSLFNTTLPGTLPFIKLFQKEPITWKVLRRLTGSPPDETPEEGGGLESLELIGVGPAKIMKLEFAPRLNLIIGDNGLGKTFLLECAWWALSGSWADPEQPAYPRSDSISSAISFKISGNPDKPIPVYFDRVAQQWPLPEQKRLVLPGVVIYARVDGSSMIWDPAKHYWSIESDRVRGLETSNAIRLNQAQIWNGLPNESRSLFICNGLIRDWIDWQFIPPKTTFETFSKVLQKLSPSHEITLIPSTPIKLPRNDLQMPRLKLPYDDVPITLLSAGMKRILSLAYLLVWTWETHKEASQHIGKPPQSKLVLIIDEMEAHLHPKWQRTIVPALLNVIKELEKTIDVQLIIATHSPLVMASVEPIFDEKTDSLFTLDLVGTNLEVKDIPYIKHGSINSWLTSEVFDLKRAYSIEAELALIDAKNLQLEEHPDPQEVRHVSQRLAENLPSIDPFWPRWVFFAEKHGVHL